MSPEQQDFLAKHGHYIPLSTAQIDFLCRKGGWLINAELKEAPVAREMGNGDCCVYSGAGVPDLDHVALLMRKYPWGRFTVDVGGPGSESSYLLIGPDDLTAWREHYIAVWGTVSRPQYWAVDKQVINGSQNIGIKWP